MSLVFRVIAILAVLVILVSIAMLILVDFQAAFSFDDWCQARDGVMVWGRVAPICIDVQGVR